MPAHAEDAGEKPAAETGRSAHPTWRFARYLAGYRGFLTRSEAARRSGLPEVLWESVETTEPTQPHRELLPASIVASMCDTVGADVATGLALAGHRPDVYPHLLQHPRNITPPTRSSHLLYGPYVATPHLVSEAIAGEPADIHVRLASVYRALARSNWEVANRVTQSPPDERAEYWAGHAAAVRAVAEQQAWAADQETARYNRGL